MEDNCKRARQVDQLGFPYLRWFEFNDRCFLVNGEAVAIYELSEADAETVRCVIPEADTLGPETGERQRVTQPDLPAWLERVNTAGVDGARCKVQREHKCRADRLPYVGSFCVHLTHACNLQCTYCPISRLYPVRPQRKRSFSCPEFMSRSVADGFVRFFVRFAINAAEPKATPRVTFFGGEPMLAFGMMRYIVGEMNRLLSQDANRVQYQITTNGTVLSPEHLDFFVENDFSVTVSIDGPPSLHDKNRPFHDSSGGTYDLVRRNIASLHNRGIRLELRATVPAEECDFCAIAQVLMESGATSFAIEPAYFRGLTEADCVLDSLGYSLREWAKRYVDLVSDRDISFLPFSMYMRQLRVRQIRTRACGAGLTYVSIDTAGNIWPCSFWAGQELREWRLGHVREGFSCTHARRVLQALDVFTREGCDSCWARLFCGAACLLETDRALAAPSLSHRHPKGSRLLCSFQKECIKAAAWICAELRREGRPVW